MIYNLVCKNDRIITSGPALLSSNYNMSGGKKKQGVNVVPSSMSE